MGLLIIRDIREIREIRDKKSLSHPGSLLRHVHQAAGTCATSTSWSQPFRNLASNPRFCKNLRNSRNECGSRG